MEGVLNLIIEKSPNTVQTAKHALMCVRSGSAPAQDRYNSAAKAALKDALAEFTDAERKLIASLINEYPYN